MTTTAVPAGVDRHSARYRQAHRRLLTAGLVGSSIEWYDFFLYGTAAALVFPHVFFPHSTPLMGTLLAFSTFWAGFIARPIGGVLAGHFGDIYGRKPVVVAALAGMGISTFVIGCLPGAATLGVIAPILLVTCRFIQGVACGGQWGGISLLLTESASPKKRGFAGTFSQMGVPLGALLGNVVFLSATWSLAPEAFLTWGWRVPFWLTAVLFPVVFYIQTRVEDTPEFKLVEDAARSRRTSDAPTPAPLREAVRVGWKQILLGCGVLASTNALFYVSIAGVLSYATSSLGMDHNVLLASAMISMALGAGVILIGGRVSDHIGRRPIIIIGGLGIVLWAFPYFALVNTGSIINFVIAVCVGSVFQSMVYAPLAAFLGELFAPRIRLSGASLAYQLAAITISGGTPFLMTWLIAAMGNTHGIAAFIAFTGVLTVGCAMALRETNPAEIRADPDAVPGSHLYHGGVRQ